MAKLNKGFTLIEALTSLALFMLLSLGVLFLWQHAAAVAEKALLKQNALDNLYIAMDAFTTNIQFSHSLELTTDSQDVLIQLDMLGFRNNNPHTYVYRFNRNAGLTFGNQQFVYGIDSIRIVYIPHSRFDITIESSQIPGLSIEGSVDVRLKHVTLR